MLVILIYLIGLLHALMSHFTEKVPPHKTRCAKRIGPSAEARASSTNAFTTRRIRTRLDPTVVKVKNQSTRGTPQRLTVWLSIWSAAAKVREANMHMAS